MLKQIYNINGIKVNFVCFDEKIFKEQIKTLNNHFLPNNDNNCIDEITIYFIKDGIIFNKAKSIKKGKSSIIINPYNKNLFQKYKEQETIFFYSQNNDFIAANKNNNKYFIINNNEKYNKHSAVNIILEIISKKLENNNNYLFHSTGFKYNGLGCLLLSESGGGKTTLFTKLTNISEKLEFLSNDRVLIDKEGMKYFPIDITYSYGTIKNDKYLTEYFKNVLQNLDLPISDNKKTSVHPSALKHIYKDKNFNLIKQSDLDLIIIPKINFKNKETIKITQISDQETLKKIYEESCFTPKDKESERFPWIEERLEDDYFYYKNSKIFIEKELLQKPVICIEFGIDCDLSKFKQKFNKTLASIFKSCKNEKNDGEIYE